MTDYVVLLPGNEADWDTASEERRAEVYGRHNAFAEALAARGHTMTGGAELTHSREARVVHVGTEGPVVTDGPYAETAEQLGGFYTVRSDDLDDLLQVCALLAGVEGPVEVRAAVDHSGGGS